MAMHEIIYAIWRQEPGEPPYVIDAYDDLAQLQGIVAYLNKQMEPTGTKYWIKAHDPAFLRERGYAIRTEIATALSDLVDKKRREGKL